MRAKAVLVVVLPIALVVGACSDSESSPTPSGASASIATASADQRQQITAAVAAFEKAATAEALCATITRGLEAAIAGHGAAPTIPPAEGHRPASDNCVQVVNDAKDAGELELKRTKASVGKIVVQLDRAAAHVNEAGIDRPFFMLETPTGWLVNNFGSAPPDYRQLADALGS